MTEAQLARIRRAYRVHGEAREDELRFISAIRAEVARIAPRTLLRVGRLTITWARKRRPTEIRKDVRA